VERGRIKTETNPRYFLQLHDSLWNSVVLFFFIYSKQPRHKIIINRQESTHILALNEQKAYSRKMRVKSLHILLRKIALANAVAASIWTLIIVLPIEPFSLLLRIIVGGGPGIWFIMGYLLFITVGFCGLAGLSYIYYSAEKEGNKINNQLAVLGLVLTCVGTIATTIMLQLAGAIGGYEYTIMRAPTEKIRLILEPLVNPIRLLVIMTSMGVTLLSTAVLFAKKSDKATHELSNLKSNKHD
jgi:hypothetical protein